MVNLEDAMFADCKERLGKAELDHLDTKLGYDSGIDWLREHGEVPNHLFGQVSIFCSTSLSDDDPWTRVLHKLLVEYGLPHQIYEGLKDPRYTARKQQLDGFRKRTGFAELSDFYVVNATDPEYAAVATEAFAKKVRRGTVLVKSTMAQEPMDSLRSQIGFEPKTVANSINPTDNRLCNVFAECHSFLEGNYRALKPVYDHYSSAVFLLHGKGTFGSWVQKFKTKLEALGFCVESASFDFVHQGNFFTPGQLYLSDKVDQVSDEFSAFCTRVGGRKKFVIAHSFGSFLMGQALKHKPSCLEGGLIFCGSIATREMEPVLSSATGDSRRILNDVGVLDRWPAVATGWFVPYGQVGYEGFKRAGIHDRFHKDVDHKGFFTEDFVEEYWVPFLSQGKVVRGTAEHMNDSILWKLQSLVPLEIWVLLAHAATALVAFLLAAIFYSFGGWFWGVAAFVIFYLFAWIVFYRLV